MSRVAAAVVCTILLAGCPAEKPLATPEPRETASPSPTVAGQPGLPEAVAEVRAGILTAAAAGDYELLRAWLDPEVFLSDFGFGTEDEPDPIARWKEMGEKPLEIMAALLGMDYTEMDTNEGHLYQWPIYDAETKDIQEVRGSDREQFLTVMTRQELRRLVPDAEYGYIGPRLGILKDGTWWFFIMEPGP